MFSHTIHNPNNFIPDVHNGIFSGEEFNNK